MPGWVWGGKSLINHLLTSKAEHICNQSLHWGWCSTAVTGGTEITKRNNHGTNTLQKLMNWQHFHHCVLVCKQPSKCPENHRQPSQRAEGLVPLGYAGSPAPFLTAVNAMGLHRHCPGSVDMQGAHRGILYSPSWAVIKPHLGHIRWNRCDAILRHFLFLQKH